MRLHRCHFSIVVMCWLVTLFPAPAGAQLATEDFQSIHTGPGLSLHKEIYMLPFTYSDHYNRSQTEAVFQLSAKHRIFGTRFYFAYTQISFWQAYDYRNSSPFRETDYNPELFYRTKRFPFKSGNIGADVGFEHESNGQRPPLSRSWNLLYVAPYYYRSNLLVHMKLRYRIPEDEKEYPLDPVGDDNPDITDYLGYSDIHMYYIFWRDHMIHLMARGNIDTGNGGVSLNYSLPVPNGDKSFVAFRVSYGYGESLVDYKKSIFRFGIGLLFAR